MFEKIIKILAGVLIEKGLKPLIKYIGTQIELAKKKRANKKKVKKLNEAKNEDDFDSGFDDMP